MAKYDAIQKLMSYEGYDKVFRDMIKEEISLQHKTLGWANALQAFLFTGYFSGHAENNLIGITIVGLVCYIISKCTYFTSETKVKRILYFWDGNLQQTEQSYFDFPPV